MDWEAMVREKTLPQTFRRAETLLAAGKVEILSCQSGDTHPEILHIQARIQDSTEFVCEVDVDTSHTSIISQNCSCAADTSRFLCKHAAAALLSAHDSQKVKPRPVESDEAYSEVPEVNTSSPSQSPTSAKLKEQTRMLLDEYRHSYRLKHSTQSALEVCESQTSIPISNAIFAYSSIQPAFISAPTDSFSHKEIVELADIEIIIKTLAPKVLTSSSLPVASWEIRLRIRSGAYAYAVRKIEETIDAWERGLNYSYGKDLSFVHAPQNFTRRANEALAIIRRIIQTQQACRSAQAGYWSQGRSSATRSLFVSDSDLCDLLDVYAGGKVTYDPSTSSFVSKPVLMDVREQDPEIQISLEEGVRGGFDLYLPRELNCALDLSRMYLFHDGHVWRCSAYFREHLGLLLKSLLPGEPPWHIRKKDMPGFCQAVLPAIKDVASFESNVALDDLTPAEPEFIFRISSRANKIVCEAKVRYGSDTLNVFCEPAPQQPFRNQVRESEIRNLILRYFEEDPKIESKTDPSHFCFDASNTDALHNLLVNGTREMRECATLYLSENLRSIRVRSVPKVRVQASVRSGLLDIAVDSSDLTPLELETYLKAYQRKERFVRMSTGDIIELGGGLQALVELADGLGVSPKSLVEGTSDIPANRTLFVNAILKRSDHVRFDRNEGFRSIVRQFNSIADADFVEPKSLRGILRPYQREGFKWLMTLAELGFGAILADDMGLGKTLQFISFLLAQHEKGCALPSLVICPASLVYNWMAEFERFAPELKTTPVVAAQQNRRSIIKHSRDYDVLITSYELLKRDIEDYMDQDFYCQVLDEAQYIKNALTQAACCTKLIHARVRFALTGTPIENRLAELWSIFDYLMPGLLGSQEEFRATFEEPIALGDKDASLSLQTMVGPFILRRLKQDVLKDLPEKNETVLYAALEGEQDKLYRATAAKLAYELRHQKQSEFAQRQFAILAELTKLRQICCDPRLLYDSYSGPSSKLDACLELVHSAVENSHKVLLFSQFTSMLALIARRLEEDGLAYHELIGSTPKETRARLVASFQSDDVPIFLVSLKAGGVGLNLTAADVVIHYDPWWNLAAQNQATDRAHRIGQTKSVNVLRLITKDTIEEKILALQESKRQLAESILGGAQAGSSTLTREDILALLM